MTTKVLTMLTLMTLFITSCGKKDEAHSVHALNGAINNVEGIVRVPKQGMTGIQPTFVYGGISYSFGQQTSQQVIQQIYQLYYASSGTGGMGGHMQFQPVENNASYTGYRARITGHVVQVQPGMQQNVSQQALIQVNTMQVY